MAYMCKLGIGDNPTTPGSYVDLSSNSADNAIVLAPQGAFVWQEGQILRSRVKQGKRKGVTVGAIEYDNASLTINLNITTANQDLLLARINAINAMIFLAQQYNSSNGSTGSPIMLTIQLHATSKPIYFDVVDGTPLGPLTSTIADGYWLNSWLRDAKLSLICRPEARGDRVSLANWIINGDFQNTINTTSNTGGIDGVTLSSGWAINATDGYFGYNCLAYTGLAGSSGFVNAVFDTVPVSTVALNAGTPIVASCWMRNGGSTQNAFACDAKLQANLSGTWTDVSFFGSQGANFGTAWVRVSGTYTVPASGCTGVRIVCDTDQREAATVKIEYDGFAIWSNVTSPPVEYMTQPGNPFNGARLYNVQGTEAPLVKLSFIYYAAAWTAPTSLVRAYDVGINPHEAGGVIGTTNGGPQTRDAPLKFAYVANTISGSQFGNTDQPDLKQRVYLVKARLLTLTSSSSKNLSYIVSAATAYNAYSQSLTTQTLCGQSDIGTVASAIFAELGRLFFMPPVSAAATADLTATRPLLPSGTQLIIDANSQAMTASHFWNIRTDWSYAYVLTPSIQTVAGSRYTLDSEGGDLRAYAEIVLQSAPTVRMAYDYLPDVRGSALKVLPGAGYLNEIQALANSNQAAVLETDHFLHTFLEYTPKFKGGMRI